MNKNLNSTAVEMEDGIKRANRIVVNPNGENGWVAEFFKTHFSIGTIDSKNTKWTAKPDQTLTGQREDFRQFAIDNADMAGAEWIPDDLRQDWNIRVPQYSNDELVHQDIEKMLTDLVLGNDLLEYVVKFKLRHIRTEYEDIVPTYKTSKGNDIQYVTDGKYDKNGNWAWCTIPTTIVFDHEGTEIYISRNFEIVSGCLKKMKITIPDFENEVKDQISKAEVVNG